MKININAWQLEEWNKTKAILTGLAISASFLFSMGMFLSLRFYEGRIYDSEKMITALQEEMGDRIEKEEKVDFVLKKLNNGVEKAELIYKAVLKDVGRDNTRLAILEKEPRAIPHKPCKPHKLCKPHSHWWLRKK